jgi:5'-methylthioadenosine phosphorylase
MREDIHPGDLVLPDQFFDRTRGRVSSFFDQDVVVHVTFADPTCAHLGQTVYEAASKTEAKVHAGGTYICIEGPQFSTRAESRIYRQWGVDVIGMTNLPEARLAREAELCYVTIAMATDYDCWHESADDVEIEAILTLLHRNAELAQDVIRHAVPNIPRERSCPCKHALQYAMITAPEMIPAATRERFELLLGPYLT